MNRLAAHDEVTLRVAGVGTEYRLSPPHLLPEAVDPPAMLAAARAALATYRLAGESAAAARAQSAAAFMMLCVGQANEAEGVLREVIQAQAATSDEPARARSELRLVQVLQRLGRVDEAVTLAREVVARQQPESAIGHFAVHHLGKALAQFGANAEARAALLQALTIRRSLGERELIASTLRALSLLASKQENGTQPFTNKA